ncbi:MAG TPA: hypothetical protein VFR14_00885 [Candidatus Limnocylindrales bacterium]|nr:hypothetical protein [Candidatus Limnocylindrales bacterium]
MTDFDTRLRIRLEHLDGAIPEPAAWDPAAARAAGARQRGRFRRVVPALAAAILLIGAGAVGAGRVIYPDNPEPELEAALARAWSGVDCMSPEAAKAATRSALDDLGKADWAVVARPGVGQGTGCTAPLVIPPTHEVILLGVAGRELSDALAALRVETFERCLTRIEARSALSSVLAAHGVTNYDIHDGPELLYGTGSVPIDQAAAYTAHARQCYLFAGTGSDANGKPWFRLWGPWP